MNFAKWLQLIVAQINYYAADRANSHFQPLSALLGNTRLSFWLSFGQPISCLTWLRGTRF